MKSYPSSDLKRHVPASKSSTPPKTYNNTIFLIELFSLVRSLPSSMTSFQHITIHPQNALPATRDAPQSGAPASLPEAKQIKVKPNSGVPIGSGNASLFFVGTATTIL